MNSRLSTAPAALRPARISNQRWKAGTTNMGVAAKCTGDVNAIAAAPAAERANLKTCFRASRTSLSTRRAYATPPAPH